MLDLYELLSGKTVLMPSELPQLPASVISDMKNFHLPDEVTNAIAMMENAFASNGIAVVQDGPLFVRLLPVKQVSYFLTNVPLRGDQFSAATNLNPDLPRGLIDFQGAPYEQFLELYSVLRERTILRPGTLPWTVVRLTTGKGVTIRAACYAMETVLALNGIGLVDDGQKFVQAVPLSERARVTLNAPKPESGAKLLDPGDLPSTPNGPARPAVPPKPASDMKKGVDRLRTALYDFFHHKGPSGSSAKRLLELYATVADKKAEPSKGFDNYPIWYKIRTPLTRNELAYSIETTFSLSGLAIIAMDDGKIRLGRLSELGKGQSSFTYRDPSKRGLPPMRIVALSLISILVISLLFRGALRLRRSLQYSKEMAEKKQLRRTAVLVCYAAIFAGCRADPVRAGMGKRP
jgi:hypothetical protein